MIKIPPGSISGQGGGTSPTITLPASENLAAGAFVNIWNNGGTISVRNANATASGSECDGFVTTAVTAPANASISLSGTNTSLSGLSGGTTYYLSTSAGNVTSTPPSASGNVVQEIGKAYSSSSIEVGIIELGVILT